jgi:thioredoxin-dependent peroxiredoxin
MKNNLWTLALMAASAGGKPIEAGAHAPDFALPSSNGHTVKLADFRGKKAVILAWFPKVFTPG